MNAPSPAVLITGASRGLGNALARTLCPKNHIIAVGKTIGALEELDDAIKAQSGSATLVPVDITNKEAAAQMCHAIFERWGKIALWCHTAIHAPPLAPAAHIAPQDWEKTIATNVTATGGLIPMVAPLLPADGTALFFDHPADMMKFHGAFAASKAAQIALATAWAQESAATGPNVHIVTPNPMPTASRARFYPGEDKAKLASCQSEAKRLLQQIEWPL